MLHYTIKTTMLFFWRFFRTFTRKWFCQSENKTDNCFHHKKRIEMGKSLLKIWSRKFPNQLPLQKPEKSFQITIQIFEKKKSY